MFPSISRPSSDDQDVIDMNDYAQFLEKRSRLVGSEDFLSSSLLSHKYNPISDTVPMDREERKLTMFHSL